MCLFSQMFDLSGMKIKNEQIPVFPGYRPIIFTGKGTC